MRVLLDEQLPAELAAELRGHAVDTVAGRGWAGIKNGELLRRMRCHYDVLVTMDRSIEFQQHIPILPFGIVIVRAPSNRMQDLRPLVPSILAAFVAIKPGFIQRIGT
jgi:predicted nuclease of predicted toxin-antitoxin system